MEETISTVNIVRVYGRLGHLVIDTYRPISSIRTFSKCFSLSSISQPENIHAELDMWQS